MKLGLTAGVTTADAGVEVTGAFAGGTEVGGGSPVCTKLTRSSNDKAPPALRCSTTFTARDGASKSTPRALNSGSGPNRSPSTTAGS